TIDLSPSDMFSRPWDWIIRPEILTYWIEPHYLAMISPTIWALIIPAISFAIYRAFRGDSPALLAVLWFAFTCLVWIPISLITDRISYIYYFYPSVGSVCLSIAIMAGALDSLSDQTGQNRTVSKLIAAALPLYILLHLGAFVLLSPIAYIWKLPLAVAAYLVARHCLSVSHYIAMEDTSRKRSITGEGL
ncbi:MAG: hypothetical protein PHU23_11855, partial [Dehalococcoidales bacterium]|nr:hypothetical protein [Dehalococcoidales bacterium]